MFNFKVMNRALNDSELSDKAFRMLYTITNLCSYKNTDSVEIHNAHFMMVLNISERWVRKLTNELVEKGYITKTINGTSKNKLANTYTLIEVEVNDTPTDTLYSENNEVSKTGTQLGTQTGTQKFPLKNNIKINNKIITKEYINNNLLVGNGTTNEIVSLDELLNTTNEIEVNGKIIHTIAPTKEALFIPDVEDEHNEITSTESTGINIEVCDSDEQREEEKTNDIKEQIELRSADTINHITSTDTFSLTDTLTSIQEDLVINDNLNNYETIYSNDIIKITPLPPTTPNEVINEIKLENMTIEEYNKMQFETPERSTLNDEFTKRIKLINDAIEAYKLTQEEEQKAKVYSHCQICRWWYEAGKITKKQMDWVNTIHSNFEKIAQAIIINNKTKRNKAVLSHESNADNKSINRSDKTQQDANKTANLRYYSSIEQSEFEELIKNGGSQEDLKDVVEYIKCNYNGNPAIKLEKLISFCNKTMFDNCTSAEVIKELKSYITENIK